MSLTILTFFICSCYLPLKTQAIFNYAKSAQFPFEVIVAYGDQDICGGAIISEYTIVTAAHCIHNFHEPEQLSVFAGVHDYYTIPSDNSYKVNYTLLHPQYDVETKGNDVALIKLISPLTLRTATVNLIAITPTEHVNYGGKRGTVVYWELEPRARLLYADVELWPEDMCTAANVFGELAAAVDALPQSLAMICVGIPVGTCIWDDASMLIVDGTLWGVMWLNMGCESKNKPLIFTNLAFVSEWINDIY